MVHGRNIVNALGEKARDFLEASEAVKLQRVEMLALSLRDKCRLHLRFSLDFDFANVSTEAAQRLGQFTHVTLEVKHFAFNSRTRNRHFASLVHHAVYPVGTHAQS